MKRDALVLLRSIYRINKARDKVEYLEAFLDDFELLKLEIRLAADLRILSLKKEALSTDGSGLCAMHRAGIVAGSAQRNP